jgi:Domain of unknown function (DUF4440)
MSALLWQQRAAQVDSPWQGPTGRKLRRRSMKFNILGRTHNLINHSARRRKTITGCAAIIVCLGLSSQARAADDVSSVLRQKTQEFSDAGQRGDGAVMERMLADRVIFFNEGGDVATKKDIVSSATGPAPGVDIKMTVTDWNCESHGNVAVTSFIDDQVVNDHGEIMHARYRSVETWLSADGDWRMIGSETIALHDDPVTVTLPTEVLDEYVGSYQAASGSRFTFSRAENNLLASLNEGPTTVQSAEVRDVFFTPGRARFRKVFQRDGNGHVIAFAYRREGHDTIYKRL